MCHVSSVKWHMTCITCHVSCVMCLVSLIACHLLLVTCHLSLTPTATASVRLPASSLIMQSRLVCMDIKFPKKIWQATNYQNYTKEKNIYRYTKLSYMLFDQKSPSAVKRDFCNCTYTHTLTHTHTHTTDGHRDL